MLKNVLIAVAALATIGGAVAVEAQPAYGYPSYHHDRGRHHGRYYHGGRYYNYHHRGRYYNYHYRGRYYNYRYWNNGVWRYR